MFRFRERFRFQVRAEFFKAFNRIVMPQPSAGFGRIDASSVSGQRNGQIIARVEW